MHDSAANTFGLPESVLIPIAAQSLSSIETYVGKCIKQKISRNGRINALLIEPFEKPNITRSELPLWNHLSSDEHFDRLHPDRQVWVHTDYSGYRAAYLGFGMPPIPDGYVLDHVQNREAARLKNYTRPLIRVCVVSRAVNTSGGHSSGPEGMEKRHLRNSKNWKNKLRRDFEASLKSEITYADPVDICKILNRPPGTELENVAEIQRLIYPRKLGS